MKNYNPDWVSPPGDTLKEWIQENSMEERAVTLRLNLTPSGLASLLVGELRITDELADRLGFMTGTSIAFWLNREDDYRKEPRRTE